MSRTAATILGVALVGAALTACDPGPACADYATTTHLVTAVGVNGKVTTHLVTDTVCVRYEEAEPK